MLRRALVGPLVRRQPLGNPVFDHLAGHQVPEPFGKNHATPSRSHRLVVGAVARSMHILVWPPVGRDVEVDHHVQPLMQEEQPVGLPVRARGHREGGHAPLGQTRVALVPFSRIPVKVRVVAGS